jgi:hypothetical protein
VISSGAACAAAMRSIGHAASKTFAKVSSKERGKAEGGRANAETYSQENIPNLASRYPQR